MEHAAHHSEHCYGLRRCGDLGLDSIDALEIALAVSKRYGFQLRSDNDDNKRIFGSLRALSAHIEQNRTV